MSRSRLATVLAPLVGLFILASALPAARAQETAKQQPAAKQQSVAATQQPLATQQPAAMEEQTNARASRTQEAPCAAFSQGRCIGRDPDPRIRSMMSHDNAP